MPITDLFGLANGGSRTANQATLTVATTAAVAAGELVVVAVAVDNSTSQPLLDDISVAQVTFGGSSLVKVDSSGPNAAAQTGPGLSIWYGVASSAVASGQNIVVSFSNNATSDHAALNARHFSFTGSSLTVESSVRQFVNTATDPPSMDITTANAQRLRYRAVSGRHTGSVGLGYTPAAGWASGTAYSGNAGGTSPDWEITAYAESVVFTGTNKISDPTVFSGPATINANVYVVFVEGPITAALVVAESGDDSASFPGGVTTFGTLEAYEGAVWLTADSTVLTADDNITRVNTAGQIRDVAAFSGQVLSGITGVLAATEGADTASFAGTAAFPVITGTLAATEAADVASFAGGVVVSGALVATEGADAAAFTGNVFSVITGTLAATEDADTTNIRGVITNAGTLDAVEVDSDTAAFAGFAFVPVTLAATEAPDVSAFEGYVSLVDEKIGILDAHESGGVGGAIEPTADSTLVTADQTTFTADLDNKGGDHAHFTGEISTNAVIDATEAADTASFAGGVSVEGVLEATEAQDEASLTGTSGFVITGVLAAQEAADTARFTDLPLFVFGVLAAVEGSDSAYFTIPMWEQVGDGAGLENEVLRTVWLAGQGGRVRWLENEVEDVSDLQNLNPEVISLTNEVLRITELRP